MVAQFSPLLSAPSDDHDHYDDYDYDNDYSDDEQGLGVVFLIMMGRQTLFIEL